jgi:hypothetical protein
VRRSPTSGCQRVSCGGVRKVSLPTCTPASSASNLAASRNVGIAPSAASHRAGPSLVWWSGTRCSTWSGGLQRWAREAVRTGSWNWTSRRSTTASTTTLDAICVKVLAPANAWHPHGASSVLRPVHGASRHPRLPNPRQYRPYLDAVRLTMDQSGALIRRMRCAQKLCHQADVSTCSVGSIRRRNSSGSSSSFTSARCA